MALDEYLSPETIAERLGVDESTVWRWHKLYMRTEGREGLGPVHKLGHRLSRFAGKDVRRFVESRAVLVAK